MQSDTIRTKLRSGELCILEVAGRLFGETVRDELWQALGGTKFYVPRRPQAEHRLSGYIGLERARAVASELGGVFVDVPRSPSVGHRARREAVLRAKLAGKRTREIVTIADCTERQVRRIIKQLRENGDLPPSVHQARSVTCPLRLPSEARGQQVARSCDVDILSTRRTSINELPLT